MKVHFYREAGAADSELVGTWGTAVAPVAGDLVTLAGSPWRVAWRWLVDEDVVACVVVPTAASWNAPASARGGGA